MPTATAGTNTTQIASTAFVTTAISGISSYAPLASPAFTGTPTAPTAAAGTNTTQIATTAFALALASAKAWVNFNGTGVVAVRASFNVSSITDNGTGDYTVNFTTALVDANYAVAGAAQRFPGSGGNASNLAVIVINSVGNISSSSIRISTLTAEGSLIDFTTNCVSIFR